MLTRILVADDNPVFRNVLTRMLVGWGYEVAVACDDEEAWGILQAENSPKLVILDWMMPGIDGIELCRRIRGTAPLCRLYVLMLTSKSRREEVLAAIEAGSDDFVTKPFESQELRTRLRAAYQILKLREQLAQSRIFGDNNAAGWRVYHRPKQPSDFSKDRYV